MEKRFGLKHFSKSNSTRFQRSLQWTEPSVLLVLGPFYVLHLTWTSALIQKSLHTSWKRSPAGTEERKPVEKMGFFYSGYFSCVLECTQGKRDSWSHVTRTWLEGFEAASILIYTNVNTVNRVCIAINNSAHKWWWNQPFTLTQLLSA